MAASSALIRPSRPSGFAGAVCGAAKGKAMHNAANNAKGFVMVRTIAHELAPTESVNRNRVALWRGGVPSNQQLAISRGLATRGSHRRVGWDMVRWFVVHAVRLSPHRNLSRNGLRTTPISRKPGLELFLI